jgi:hypothetical protein
MANAVARLVARSHATLLHLVDWKPARTIKSLASAHRARAGRGIDEFRYDIWARQSAIRGLAGILSLRAANLAGPRQNVAVAINTDSRTDDSLASRFAARDAGIAKNPADSAGRFVPRMST